MEEIGQLNYFALVSFAGACVTLFCYAIYLWSIRK
jgi:hypothetical protein